MKILLFFFFVLITSDSNAADVVVRCDLGGPAERVVEVVRDAPIGSTHVYYLRQNGKRTPFFSTPEQSRGDVVSAACVGRHRRALIVSGEFTANALQGFVMVGTERIDFAEKVYPGWLFLGPSEIVVAFATEGYGETNARYVLYRHRIGQSGDDQIEAANELPATREFEQIKLKTLVLP
jgi:hypothetical protein